MLKLPEIIKSAVWMLMAFPLIQLSGVLGGRPQPIPNFFTVETRWLEPVGEMICRMTNDFWLTTDHLTWPWGILRI